MSKVRDLKGQRFGRLTVISRCGSSKYGRAAWLCKCDCGNEKVIVGRSLLRKATVSCGCYNKEAAKKRRTKHNMSYSKLYNVWSGMKARCYDSNFTYYNNYGGRGIEVCDEWLNDFTIFYKWAVDSGYEEGLTIDRIDNDGNYDPSNCRWATRKEQNNNMRKTIIVEYNGKNNTISELATQYNINRQVLYDRIRRGWEIERALTTPLNFKK